jgi:hypothetical protein
LSPDRLVEGISKGAFFLCKTLEWGIFEGRSVFREVGEYAFALTGLKSIVFQHRVIGNDAFRECKSLASVMFETESNMRAAGDCAFEGCPCAGGLEFPVLLSCAGPWLASGIEDDDGSIDADRKHLKKSAAELSFGVDLCSD